MKKEGWCAYCGNWRILTKDHIIPKSKGMVNSPNIVYVCTWCNQNKGNYTLEEWLKILPKHYPQHLYANQILMLSETEREIFYNMQRKNARELCFIK